MYIRILVSIAITMMSTTCFPATVLMTNRNFHSGVVGTGITIEDAKKDPILHMSGCGSGRSVCDLHGVCEVEGWWAVYYSEDSVYFSCPVADKVLEKRRYGIPRSNAMNRMTVHAFGEPTIIMKTLRVCLA